MPIDVPTRACCGSSVDQLHKAECQHYVASVAPGRFTTADPAINPSHYRSHPSGIEAVEYERHMTFLAGNATKYVGRYLLKGTPQQDLEKALWYLTETLNPEMFRDPIWLSINRYYLAKSKLELVIQHEPIPLRVPYYEALLEDDLSGAHAAAVTLYESVVA